MKRNTLIQLGISLLLGALLCYLAMRDWQWGDILDTLLPLQGERAQLVLVAAESPVPGTLLQLEHEGKIVARVTIPVRSPHASDPEPTALPPIRFLPLPQLPGEIAGRWGVRVADGPYLSAWALDLRGDLERSRARRPICLLADHGLVGMPEGETCPLPPGGSGPGSPAGSHPADRQVPVDPLLFPAAVDDRAPNSPALATILEMNWRWLLPYIAFFYGIHLLRIFRWGILLKPLGTIRPIRLFMAGSVGFMAILLFPLRLGEFIRPYLVARESDIKMTSALATCVVERVVDGLSVVLILFIVLALQPPQFAPPSVAQAGYLALAVFLGTLVALLAFRWKRDLMLRLLEQTLGRLSPGLARKLAGLVSTFLDGVQTLPSLSAFLLFIGTTVVYWLIIGSSYWILFRALGITLPGGGEPGLLMAFTVMAILAIGITLPAGPGFTGSFEISLRLGLSLFLTAGMLATRGAAYILFLHSLQFLLQILIGLIGLMFGGVSLRRVVEESRAAAIGEKAN